MKKIGIGLLGCGVVGSGVVRNLMAHKEDIAKRLDAELEIKKIADLDLGKKSDIPKLPEGLFTKDINDVISRDDVDIVVELIGGEKIAFDGIKKAIENGKHVVTANKHLLAKKIETIIQMAAKAKVEVGFEASVAGAVPVLRTLKEGIVLGGIKSIFGIVNGTANYILTKMTESNVEFNDVLKEAQKLGYAEADPTYDIEGIDAAHKITIIANMAYGTPVDFDSVYTEGISGLTPEDFDFAKQFSRVIKLLAIARMDNGRIDVRVHPAMVPCDRPIAKVDGVTNAVEIETDAADLMLIGPGAGGDATSTAVISDIVEIARNITHGCVGRVSPVAFSQNARKKLALKPIDEVESCYYMRFSVDDKPGVLAAMSGILGKNNISIESVIQKGRSQETVPLVILTHEASEKNVRAAVKELDELETTRSKTKIIRLL